MATKGPSHPHPFPWLALGLDDISRLGLVVCGSKVLGLALEDTMVLGLGLRLDRWHLDGRVRARWHLGELRQAGC